MTIKKTNIIGYKKIKDNNGIIHKIPIILCEIRKDYPKGMQFYCEFCKRVHLHGESEGHRIAHCHSEMSPFAHTGYIIQRKQKNGA